MERVITGLVGILIFVLLATAFAGTISDSVDTDAGEPLENVSGTSKVVYGTIDIMYAVLILLGIVGAFGLGKKL